MSWERKGHEYAWVHGLSIQICTRVGFESKCTHQLVTVNLQSIVYDRNNNYKTATTSDYNVHLFGCASFLYQPHTHIYIAHFNLFVAFYELFAFFSLSLAHSFALKSSCLVTTVTHK